MVADVSVCVCELQLLSDELLKISSLSLLYLAAVANRRGSSVMVADVSVCVCV